MKKALIILTTIFVPCVSCELFQDDDEPQTELEKLPPITHTGENTFGCLVNGEALFNSNSAQMHAIYQGGGIQFGSGKEDDFNDRDVNFVLLDPLETNKKYNLTNFPVHRAMFRSTAGVTTCLYEYEDTYNGTLTFLKIDRTNFIISGTFEFSTVTEDCDTVRITDGRFDMQYIP